MAKGAYKMKRMKKKISVAVTAFFLFVFASSGFTQVMDAKFDIYAIFGWGIPIGGYYIGTSQKVQNVATVLEEKDHYLNYGRGLHLEGGVNFKTMENIKAQISFNYTRNVPATKIEFENTTVSEFNNEDKYSVNLIGFKALLIPYFNAFDLIEMYTGIGIGLFFNKSSIKGSNVVHNQYEGNIKTKPALAFCSKLGADFPLNDMFSLFGELTFDAMSFRAESMQTTSSPNKITFDRNNNTLSAPPKVPGSNFGINIGLRLLIL